VSIASLPLSRFTVLDLTHARAGPTAVRQLADWGAKVIKIEPPGEDSRDVTGSRREGFDFQNLHRNKRSLALNLKRGNAVNILQPRAFRCPARDDIVSDASGYGLQSLSLCLIY
jgi:crotonobetainyl-CoA:carnitine CoA-transferase CaiB-like acyl-CoA transferase